MTTGNPSLSESADARRRGQSDHHIIHHQSGRFPALLNPIEAHCPEVIRMFVSTTTTLSPSWKSPRSGGGRRGPSHLLAGIIKGPVQLQ